MTKLSMDDLQDLATEVSGLAQGVDQLYFGNTKQGREAIPPMLSSIAEKASALSNGLDSIHRPAPHQTVVSMPAEVDRNKAMHQAVTLKYLIENAANLDNESRGDELTTILGVLSEKAEALVDTLDAPRAVAAE